MAENDKKKDEQDELDDPGFIDDSRNFDDQVQKSTDQSQRSAGSDFNPFVDVGKVDTGMAAVGSGPTDDPSAGGMINQEGVGPISSSMPTAAQLESGAEEDVVPGSGRDLWTCPHCSARNKPGRDTCRSCGKRPDEEVASPLKQKLPLYIGIGVLVLIVLAFLIFGGTDTSFRPAGEQQVDIETRIDNGRLAASGRVLSVTTSEHGPLAVLLVYAPLALDDDRFQTLTAELDSQINVKRDGRIIDESQYALIHLVSDEALPTVNRGDYLSVAGDELRKPALRRFEYVVGVDQIGVEASE